MITWKDLYTVLTAVVPLYVAMILAYGSVRWWKIFSPDQCSGINRFVAVFAVPLLSFHFISANDIYAMNLRFVAADTLQKLIVLLVLVLWANLSRNGSLDWAITIFSLSTLPNTLVMGIPLLIAMYAGSGGTDPKSLMVQVVVLQCIIWYTLLLFLFEFRAAKLLIMEQFPETAAAIISFKVDPDVVSLDGGPGFLETDAEIREDGKLRVTVRKSNASRRSLGPCSVPAFTPRPSNLSDVEIYSMSSSRNPTPRGSNFNNSDCYSMMGFQGRPSNFGPADVHSVQSSTGPTPRTSNYVENWVVPAPRFGYNPAQTVPAPYPAPDPELSSVGKKKSVHDGKELHMFVWSACESPGSEAGGVFGGPEMGRSERFGGSEEAVKEIRMLVADHPETGERKAMAVKVEEEPRYEYEERERVEGGSRKQDSGGGKGKGKGMPAASVMSRLIMLMVWRKLVRNPNTYSSLIGLIWSLVAFRWDVRMPKIIEESIAILSDAGLGMAMFSLGLFMGLQAKIIACGKSAAVLAMAVRFLMGPAVMAVASTAVGLRGTLLHIAIVQAALPQGIVPFVFAKEYNLHPAILSTAVIFGMLIALPITLVYYILLGL